MSGAEPSLERSLARRIPAPMERPRHHGDRHASADPSPAQSRNDAGGPIAREPSAEPGATRGAGICRGSGDTAFGPGPRGGDIANLEGRVARPAAQRAETPVADSWRRPLDRGRRLQGEER